MNSTEKRSRGGMTLLWVILISASFLSATLIQIQAQTPWARYDATGEEFSVMLPERPAAFSKLRPELASGKRPPIGVDMDRGRIYGAYGDGIVFVIMSFDKGRAEKLDYFIATFQKYFRPQVQLSFVREFTRHDIFVKEYGINIAGAEGVAYFYLTKSHVYVVQAVGGNQRNPNVHRFLTSLTMNGKSLLNDIPAPKEEEQHSPSQATGTLAANGSLQPSEVFSVKSVSRPAVVVMRPEPRFPRPGDIQGRIRIKAVLSSSGKVENINVVESARKLSAEAVEAVRHIKFIPAIKDGRFVSQYIQVEYHFNTF